MAAEETMTAPTSAEDCRSGNKPSDEKMALTDFAYRLGSFNYLNEPGIAGDEGSTRMEAKLLMCLCASPPRRTRASPSFATSAGLVDPVSSSESEASLASSDSACSARNRDSFTFTCPSLSLESSGGHEPVRSEHPRSSDSSTAECLSDLMEKTERVIDEPPVPAKLLGRPLKVDDRDALRLSADAMARNIRQSYQKALQWRVGAWIHALSKKLVQREIEMAESGASKEEIKCLLETCEARLILQLREVADSVQVSATATTFQVLGQCDPKEDGEPLTKKPRLDVLQQQLLSAAPHPEPEEGDYQYVVSHVLRMECVIGLHTPAGFSEVTLQVPGTIEGTFLSTETSMQEELKSIVIELDTDILAAMVEKSCRTIARASVEAVAERKSREAELDVSADPSSRLEDLVAAELMTDIKTPPPHSSPSAGIISANEVRAALITPQAHFNDANSRDSSSSTAGSSPKPMLMPIPDNFDDHHNTNNKNGGGFPRRISPQPHMPFASELEGNPHFTSPQSVSAPSSTSSPSNDVMTSHHHHSHEHQQQSSGGSGRVPSLVSPQLNESSIDYPRFNPENVPSLPMLVEAACRVMQD